MYLYTLSWKTVWISYILLYVHKAVSVNNMWHTHLCWALILEKTCSKNTLRLQSPAFICYFYVFKKAHQILVWGSVPVNCIMVSGGVWSNSYFCAFSYFFLVPSLCSAHRVSKAQLRNSCWMFSCLLVLYLLFKSYSEYRIINVIVSIPLAIKVF